GSSPVPIFAVLLALRRATARPVHPADLPPAHRRCTPPQSCPLRPGTAPWRGMSLVHGVDAHFASGAPPGRTGSCSLSCPVSKAATFGSPAGLPTIDRVSVIT